MRHDLQITTGVQGDILYRDSNGELINLGVGTDGEVLTLVAGLPSWETSSGAGVGIPLGTPRQVLRMDEAGTATEWQVDYYDAIVDAAGEGHYTDLNTAISTEPVNATIFVKDGTYALSSSLSVKADQKIVGESKEHTVISLGSNRNISMGAGSSLQNVTITAGVATTGTYSVISIAATDVLIDNIVIMSISGTATNIYGIEVTSAGDRAILRNIKIGTMLCSATLLKGITLATGPTDCFLENIVIDTLDNSAALTTTASCCGIHVAGEQHLSNISISNITGASAASSVTAAPVLAALVLNDGGLVNGLLIQGLISSATNTAIVAAIHVLGTFGRTRITNFDIIDVTSNGGIKTIYIATDLLTLSNGGINTIVSTNNICSGIVVDNNSNQIGISNVGIFGLTASSTITGILFTSSTTLSTITGCNIRMQNPGPAGTGIQIDGDQNVVVGNTITDALVGVLISATADRTILGSNMILGNTVNLTNAGTNGATANNISA